MKTISALSLALLLVPAEVYKTDNSTTQFVLAGTLGAFQTVGQ